MIFKILKKGDEKMKEAKFVHVIGVFVVLLIVTGIFFYSSKNKKWTITTVSGVTMISREVSDDASYLGASGRYGIGVSSSENNTGNRAIYFYDTNNTLDDFSDDTYTIVAESSGDIYWNFLEDNYITWVDAHMSTTDPCLSILKYYDLTTHETEIITDKLSEYPYSRDGNKVVYTEKNGSDSNIKLFDLSTKNYTDICTNPSKQSNPDIKGNIVVWEDYRNENLTGIDLYMFDLTTNSETRITNSTSDEFKPVTNGVSISYHLGSLSSVCIYTTLEVRNYEIATASDFLLYSVPTNIKVGFEDISSNYLVWSETSTSDEGKGTLLKLYNLDNSSLTTIVEDNSDPYRDFYDAYLSETQLVWIDGTSDKASVYGYNLSTSQLYPIKTTGYTVDIFLDKEVNHVVMSTIYGSFKNPEKREISVAIIP